MNPLWQNTKSQEVQTEASPLEALKESLMVFKLTLVAYLNKMSVIKKKEHMLKSQRYSGLIMNINMVPITPSHQWKKQIRY